MCRAIKVCDLKRGTFSVTGKYVNDITSAFTFLPLLPLNYHTEMPFRSSLARPLTSAMATIDLKLKLANTFATFLVVGVHGFSFHDWFFGHGGQLEVRDFAIGLVGLLHLLLVGFAIYQWLPSAPKDTIADGIKYWYFLLAVTNSVVAVFWYLKWNIAAFIALLWLLSIVVFIYHHLRNYPPRNTADFALVNAPFSIFTAYYLFLGLVSLFWFSDYTREHPVVHTLIIVFVGFVALHLIDYSWRHDWVYAATTAWILLGMAIFLDGAPHVAALVTVGVLASSISRATMADWLDSINARFSRAVHDVGERTPLLA